ncbi:hypothetical protein FQN49_000895, partial [Arthroderma sp. PD_2]
PPSPGSPAEPPSRQSKRSSQLNDESETPAERKRRLAALGTYQGSSMQPDSDSEDDGEPRAVKGKVQFADGTKPVKKKSAAVQQYAPPSSSAAPVPDLPAAPPAAVTTSYSPDGSNLFDNGKVMPGSASRSINEASGNGNNGNEGTPSSGSKISWGGERGR